MTKYRKKPIEVEAWQFTAGNIGGMPSWCDPDWFTPGKRAEDDYALIRTLEGVMRATPGDYIIKGVKGEVYPCKPDIFEETYEKVEG